MEGLRDQSRDRLKTMTLGARQMIDMAILADEAGLDNVGVGEHHGAGFVNSATAVTVAAMARATEQIRLTSAVTLLSTADPVRTFQEFATADLISSPRTFPSLASI
jgi:alkanesulfonate monooxygenase SsuD/methylene tetrahydromethanopterin reductase-like flavin-dependent oxidoreductase (luciferase family)